MKKWFKIINKFLLYSFFVVGIILLYYGTGRISTMLTAFGSFIASLLLAWVLHIKNINEKYWLYINIGLWLNLAGEAYVYYRGLFVYDKLLHLAIGILATMIVYDYYKENSELKKDAVFFTVLGMLAFFEIYEYSMDTFFGAQLQGVIRNGVYVQSPFADTMHDLIWGAIGSLAYLFFRKEKIDVSIKKNVRKTNIRFSTFLKKHLKW